MTTDYNLLRDLCGLTKEGAYARISLIWGKWIDENEDFDAPMSPETVRVKVECGVVVDVKSL